MGEDRFGCTRGSDVGDGDCVGDDVGNVEVMMLEVAW